MARVIGWAIVTLGRFGSPRLYAVTSRGQWSDFGFVRGKWSWRREIARRDDIVIRYSDGDVARAALEEAAPFWRVDEGRFYSILQAHLVRQP